MSISISIGIGLVVGKWIREAKNDAGNQSLGSVVSATLALLGFILAITLSIVSSRFSIRKGLVLEEANAIGTAILRTDFLDEPFRSESKELLTQYVDVRAQVQDIIQDSTQQGLPEAEATDLLMEESNTILEKLWSLVGNASNAYQESELFALYVSSVNEVIDLHTSRYNQGLQYRLSRGLWGTLYIVTILAMIILGYEFSINNSNSLFGVVLLPIIFSSVLLLIYDLDKGGRGTIINVSQQPILDLQEQLRNSRDLDE
ncbi:MAG: hypothetical protein AB4050_00470 [Synechococcus sp.]